MKSKNYNQQAMYNTLISWADSDMSEVHSGQGLRLGILKSWEYLNGLRGGFMTSQDQ